MFDKNEENISQYEIKSRIDKYKIDSLRSRVSS